MIKSHSKIWTSVSSMATIYTLHIYQCDRMDEYGHHLRNDPWVVLRGHEIREHGYIGQQLMDCQTLAWPITEYNNNNSIISFPTLGQSCNPIIIGSLRSQVNQITAFIDASNVYGSDLSESRKLRLGSGGRMRVTKFRKEELLPLNPDECSDKRKNH